MNKIKKTILFMAAIGWLLLSPNAFSAPLPSPSATPATENEEYDESLSEREKLAKSLIETVQRLLENGDRQTKEQLLKEMNIPQTSTQSKKVTSKKRPSSSHKESAPTLNPAPASERYTKSNNNPRPYLGEEVPEESITDIDLYGDEYEDDGLEEDITLYEDSIPESALKSLFPFLNPAGDEEVSESKGNYIWVPDSVYEQVTALIEGRATTVAPGQGKWVTPGSEIDPLDEMVIFRGDTIPMVIKDRKVGRFDRKLYNYLAYPRGIWGAALTASYGELSTEDLELLSLLSDITVKGHIFSIKPAIYYFIKNNVAIGLRLAYTEGRAGIESFKVDIDDDMNFSLSDIGYHSENYQAGITLTRYYGLSRRNRIHLTNEVELAFSSGNSDFRRPFNGVPKETHTTSMKAQLTFSPGVSIQIMRNVSFDLSFGAFGVYIARSRVSVDGVDEGSQTTSGANFRFNIFNINFGIGVHI